MVEEEKDDKLLGADKVNEANEANGANKANKANGANEADGTDGTVGTTGDAAKTVETTPKYADGVKSWQEAADYYGYKPEEYMKPYDAGYLNPAIKDIQDRLATIKTESAEERKKREKREASRKIIKSVGDGLSAIANLILTTKGAPSMYDPNTQGQMAKYEQRLREEAAKRDKDSAERYKLLLAANQMAEQRARLLAAGMDTQRTLMDSANKDIWSKKTQPYKWEQVQDEARKAKADADYSEIRRKYAPQMYGDKHQVAGSQVKKNEAAATKSLRGGSGGGRRGGSGSNKKDLVKVSGYDSDAKERYEYYVPKSEYFGDDEGDDEELEMAEMK